MTKAEEVGISSSKLEHIGESMRKLIDEKKIPSTVTLVSRKGKVVHFEANGLRDVERKLEICEYYGHILSSHLHQLKRALF